MDPLWKSNRVLVRLANGCQAVLDAGDVIMLGLRPGEPAPANFAEEMR